MLSMSSALDREAAKGINRQITSKARNFMMISFSVSIDENAVLNAQRATGVNVVE